MRLQSLFITLVGAVLLLSSSFSAYGYIDPGTGSLIIQSVIGAIAAIGVTLKIYWHKFRILFSKNSSSSASDDNDNDGLVD